MVCEVCNGELEEKKFSRFVVGKRQVTVCTTCTTSVTRAGSGCIVHSGGAFKMPTLVFEPDGDHPWATPIAIDQGWKTPEMLEEDEDHVVIVKHLEHAMNHYKYLRGGSKEGKGAFWKYTAGTNKEECFEHSCRAIKDYYGDYWLHEIK